jgi:transposase
MDNLPAHTVAAVRYAVARAGAQVLYLRPHSPDMNPIELALSKLKALLRQDPARTIDARLRRLGAVSTPSPKPNAPTSSATPDINSR